LEVLREKHPEHSVPKAISTSKAWKLPEEAKEEAGQWEQITVTHLELDLLCEIAEHARLVPVALNTFTIPEDMDVGKVTEKFVAEIRIREDSS